VCAVLDIPELYAGSDSGISLYTIFLFLVFLYMGIPHYYYRIYPETKIRTALQNPFYNAVRTPFHRADYRYGVIMIIIFYAISKLKSLYFSAYAREISLHSHRDFPISATLLSLHSFHGLHPEPGFRQLPRPAEPHFSFYRQGRSSGYTPPFLLPRADSAVR